MGVDLQRLASSIVVGDRTQAVTLTQQAVAEGLDPQAIIGEGFDRRHGRGGGQVQGRGVLRA